MSVFNRITDIVNSNINTILDEAEDPGKMVRLMTQEMEETLCGVRSTSARYLADRKSVATQAEFHRRQVAVWESKAELALGKGREDLARSALMEKSTHISQVEVLDNELAQIDKAIAKLQHDAESLRDKLQTAKVRQKALILRGKTAQSRMKVKRTLHDSSYDDALDRFEAYERKLDDLEGEIESYDLHSQSLAAEIDALEGSKDISNELQALKDRINGRTEEHA
jgi:phage shock protein A